MKRASASGNGRASLRLSAQKAGPVFHRHSHHHATPVKAGAMVPGAVVIGEVNLHKGVFWKDRQYIRIF